MAHRRLARQFLRKPVGEWVVELELRDSNLKEAGCPKCGKGLHGAMGWTGPGEGPEPGDLTVCVYCWCICAFTEGLGLRALSDEELAKMPEETLRELDSAKKVITKALEAKR